jgi:hypothetical protein
MDDLHRREQELQKKESEHQQKLTYDLQLRGQNGIEVNKILTRVKTMKQDAHLQASNSNNESPLQKTKNEKNPHVRTKTIVVERIHEKEKDQS